MDLAVHWLTQASQRGSAAAQHHLGMMKLQGEGIAQDPPKGVALLRQAAEQVQQPWCIVGQLALPMAVAGCGRCDAPSWTGTPFTARLTHSRAVSLTHSRAAVSLIHVLLSHSLTHVLLSH